MMENHWSSKLQVFRIRDLCSQKLSEIRGNTGEIANFSVFGQSAEILILSKQRHFSVLQAQTSWLPQSHTPTEQSTWCLQARQRPGTPLSQMHPCGPCTKLSGIPASAAPCTGLERPLYAINKILVKSYGPNGPYKAIGGLIKPLTAV